MSHFQGEKLAHFLVSVANVNSQILSLHWIFLGTHIACIATGMIFILLDPFLGNRFLDDSINVDLGGKVHEQQFWVLESLRAVILALESLRIRFLISLVHLFHLSPCSVPISIVLLPAGHVVGLELGKLQLQKDRPSRRHYVEDLAVDVAHVHAHSEISESLLVWTEEAVVLLGRVVQPHPLLLQLPQHELREERSRGEVREIQLRSDW